MIKDNINFNNKENNLTDKKIIKIIKNIKKNIYYKNNNFIRNKFINKINNIIYNKKLYINFNYNNSISNKKIINNIINKYRNINIIQSKYEHPFTKKEITKGIKNNINITNFSYNNNNYTLYKKIFYMIKKNTILIIVNIINNEDGTIYNIIPIKKICIKKNILLHIDCTQLIGKLPININKINSTSITLSSNKTYGPNNISILLNSKNIFKDNKNMSIKKIIGILKAYIINKKTFKKNFIHTKHIHNNFIILTKKNKNIRNIYNIENKIPHIINILIDNNLNIITKKILKRINISFTSNCRKKSINSKLTNYISNNNNQIRIIINKYNYKIEIIELIKKIIKL